MKLIKPIVVFSLMSIMFITTSCEDNEVKDPVPENATISGTITFTNIVNWPMDGDVALSLSLTWPPTGAPAASFAITSSDLSNDTYDYIFENVAFGTYHAIAVSWQDPNDSNPATNQHILGAYGGSHPFFTEYGGTNPTAVTVSETEYELNGLDFNANPVSPSILLF